jgi:hypothetical protein
LDCALHIVIFVLFVQILDQQKKEKGAETPLLTSDQNVSNHGDDVDDKNNIEMGLTARRKTSTKLQAS